MEDNHRVEVASVLEMSLSRAWVMWRLEVGLKTMSELVALCQADVAHVTVIVDELVERGRSCRNPATPHPYDRRVRPVQRTAEV